MDWTEIEFVLDMEEERGRIHPFLDGWETIRFVMADEEIAGEGREATK